MSSTRGYDLWKKHQGSSKNQLRTNLFLLPTVVCLIRRCQRWRLSKNSLLGDISALARDRDVILGCFPTVLDVLMESRKCKSQIDFQMTEFFFSFSLGSLHIVNCAAENILALEMCVKLPQASYALSCRAQHPPGLCDFPGLSLWSSSAMNSCCPWIFPLSLLLLVALPFSLIWPWSPGLLLDFPKACWHKAFGMWQYILLYTWGNKSTSKYSNRCSCSQVPSNLPSNKCCSPAPFPFKL